MPVKARDRDSGEETGETITLFKAVPVFFQEQVEPLPSGEPTPLEPPRQELTGDSHAHLLPRLVAFCESLGYSVSFEEVDGPAGGWCDRRAKRIVVDAGVAPNAQLRTLVPWREGRTPTFGMGLGRRLSGCRSGGSERSPEGEWRSVRTMSVRWWGWRRGWCSAPSRPAAARPPVVGGVVAVAEQCAEDGGGDAGAEREQRRGAAGLGVDAELAQAAADALGSDVGARLGAGQQPRSGGLGAQGAEQCGEWVGDFDRILAELEEDLRAM
jgi:hypothetical protein